MHLICYIHSKKVKKIVPAGVHHHAVIFLYMQTRHIYSTSDQDVLARRTTERVLTPSMKPESYPKANRISDETLVKRFYKQHTSTDEHIRFIRIQQSFPVGPPRVACWLAHVCNRVYIRNPKNNRAHYVVVNHRPLL